jgi:hypothetical protein
MPGVNLELVGRWPYGPTNAVTAGVFSGKLYAFMGSGSAAQTVDLTQPSNPRVLGTVTVPGGVAGLFLAGDHRCVAAGYAGMLVIDLSNPAALKEVAFRSTPDNARDVDVQGNYAFLAADDWGGLGRLSIIRVSGLGP